MGRFAIGLLLAAVCSPVAAAQEPPDAMDLLIRSDGPLFAAKTVRLAGTSNLLMGSAGQELNSGSGGPSFEFQFQKDGKSREQTRTGNGTELRVFDGAALWSYNSSTNSYTRVSMLSYSNATLAELNYGRKGSNIVSAIVAGDEPVQSGGKTVACYVVRATYKGRAFNAANQNVTRQVWISHDQNLVLRDIWTGEYSAAGGAMKSVTTVNYTAIEWDIAMADSLFTFEPPPGSRLGTGPGVGGGIGSGSGTGVGLTGASTKPVVLRKVAPEYTPDARAAGLQGTVSLYLAVDGAGKASHVEVLHGLGLGLDDKAMEAVRQWEFQPGSGLQGGQLADVEFRLQDGGPWRVVQEGYSVQRVGQRVEILTQPVAARYVSPDPAACPANGGTTLVTGMVSSGGAPQNMRPAVPGPLGEAAVRAVAQWRFRPGTSNGSPRASAVRIEFDCGDGKAAATGSIPVGGGVSAPVIAYKQEPEYSEEARQAKLSGTVVLEVVVDTFGRPRDIRVVRPLGLGLDQKAMEAVKVWRFQPGTKNGNPVNVMANIEVNFRLL